MSAIDLSEQLGNVLQNASTIPYGLTARIYAMVLSTVAIAMGAFAWYFDYAATIVFAAPVMGQVVGSIPAGWGPYIPAIGFCITVAPTAIEMFAPRLTARSFLISLAFYGMLMFDVATDSPRVFATLNMYADRFGDGVIGQALYWIAYAILLLFASIGFELLFVVCAVVALYLFLRG
jgi:hypothetical protein